MSRGQRSSADLYASVPTNDGTYPPIRTITPHTPDLSASVDTPLTHSHGYHDSESLDTYSPPPPFADDPYAHQRSPSMNTFASEYSTGAAGPGEPAYRLRGGASPGPGNWDSDAGHSYSPSLTGSSANLNAMAYRNVAGGNPHHQPGPTDSYDYSKEGSLATGAGIGAAGASLPQQRKRGIAPPSSGGGVRGWYGRKSSKGRKVALALLALIVFLVVAVAVAVPVGIIKSNQAKENAKMANDGTEAGIPTSATPPVDWSTVAYGGNGSTVFLEDGSSFLYNNSFGGYWVSIPYNDTARAQRDVPKLNQEWDYEKNLIQGVNIGGWLVLEPFIVPGMFEPFNTADNSPNGTNNAIDEWMLSQALGSNLTNALTEHYETFITEKDFAQIAGAGLNWVRIPIGWWAIETWGDEPFLEGVAWTYFLKAITWARKYGLRINLDLHAVPGSQNGYNHSGKYGSINFLNGVMGIANAQRTLDIIRTITEFISQDQYKNVVPMFSVLNEPYATTIGSDALRHFYIETYEMMRSISGLGTGNGPFLAFHDGFATLATNVSSGGWNGFLNGWDRVAMDSHRYLCFDEPNNYGLAYQASLPCNYWAEKMNVSTNTFGLTMGGEWSLAINDCGKWLNNVGNGQRYDGTYYTPGNTTAPTFAAVGDCAPWNDWSSWDDTTKAGLKLVAEGHMDALRHWFFWTWKTGYSTDLGTTANPMWNYQLGLENGWIPANPRTAVGSCASLVVDNGFTIAYTTQPAPTLAPWMTGGTGAGTILDQDMYTSYSAWPPESIGVDYSTGPFKTAVSNLPTYTQAAPIITVPAPAQPTSFPSGYASSSIDVGDGWVQATDTASFYTVATDCYYVNPWSGAGVASPTTAYCGGTSVASSGATATAPSATSTASSSAATDSSATDSSTTNDAAATDATDATDAAAGARRLRLAKRKSTPVATFQPTPPPRPTRR